MNIVTRDWMLDRAVQAQAVAKIIVLYQIFTLTGFVYIVVQSYL